MVTVDPIAYVAGIFHKIADNSANNFVFEQDSLMQIFVIIEASIPGFGELCPIGGEGSKCSHVSRKIIRFKFKESIDMTGIGWDEREFDHGRSILEWVLVKKWD